MKKKNNIVRDVDDLKIRSYRLLLYPDNHDHMRVFKRIQRCDSFSPYYVGCWHTVGKKHTHIVLHFEYPRYYHAVCDDLNVDTRFCRPIGYSFRDGVWKRVKWDILDNAYAYLTHSNDPDKEKYPDSALFGSPSCVLSAVRAARKAESKLVSQVDSIKAIRTWIVQHYGDIITPMMFINWIVDTPFTKAWNSPWIARMIDSHNQAIYASIKKVENVDLEYAREIYERRKAAVLDAEFSKFDDLETWTRIY